MSARRRWAQPGAELTPHERILSFLRDNGSSGATAATVGVLTGCPTTQARHRLEALVRRGRVVRINVHGTVMYRAAATEQSPQGVGNER